MKRLNCFSSTNIYSLSIKFLLVLFAGIFIGSNNYCQAQTGKIIYATINSIDTNKLLTDQQKLLALYKLKATALQNKKENDTSYVLSLIKIASYENKINENYSGSINFITNALRINEALKTKGSKQLTIMAYYNLGLLYERQLIYKEALLYYDSVIISCKYFNGFTSSETDAFTKRVNIYFRIGDYEKAVEESSIGMSATLKQKDTSHYVYFLNRKAQSLYFEKNLPEALHDAFAAVPIAKLKDTFELATAYKTLGLIYEKKKMLDSSLYFFTLGLKTRTLTNKAFQISSDYNDIGNYYLVSLHQYKQAEKFYKKALLFADRMDDSLARCLKQAMIYGNLAENSLYQNELDSAAKFFLLAYAHLNINLHNNILNCPEVAQLNNVVNKDLVIGMLTDEILFFLEKFKQTKQQKFLTAGINTTRLADSVITRIRHEMVGEKSQLYWRNKTRDFYSFAMEACYLAKDNALAFYCMEESRSVLLNDKLNELSAASNLPPSAILQQEELQAKISKLEQQLFTISNKPGEYQNTQLQLLNTKRAYEQFIASLEKNYPAYYQYKYENNIPSLKTFQQYLKNNNQSFIHYFIGDTASYVLAITPVTTKFLRLSKKDFNQKSLADFIALCSNQTALNNNYDSFAVLSNSIYKSLFQPLHLTKGRTIICMDNIIIPFDALCTDTKGNNFLLNDYSFNYVYSARSLLKQFNNVDAKGDFVGFAPVHYNPALHVESLLNAGNAISTSAAWYKNNKLFINNTATRQNFFTYISSYSVANIFSHALADTTGNEPMLFMQDSVIHLSELGLLDKPATKLVMLSACETDVGKTATGEGVYSLARGFATIGIPSIAATLWNADEQSIYTISEKFNQYLSEGMNKDEALQKAKLNFMQSNKGSQKMLPYYWANMILIGNTDEIKFSGNNNYLWWLAAAILLIATATFVYIKIRRSKS